MGSKGTDLRGHPLRRCIGLHPAGLIRREGYLLECGHVVRLYGASGGGGARPERLLPSWVGKLMVCYRCPRERVRDR